MDSLIFFQILVSTGYDKSKGVEYVSNSCTQFRHLDPLYFTMFEEEKFAFTNKNIFLASYMDEREILYFL